MLNTQTSIRASILTMLLIAFSTMSYGSNRIDVVTESCSGVREDATTDSDLLSCTDNFTISNGTITSTQKLIISGTSSVTLANVKLIAPSIEIRSNGSISLGTGVDIQANSAVISTISGPIAPAFYAAPGATISIAGAPASQIVPTAVAIEHPSSAEVAASAGTVALLPAAASSAAAISSTGNTNQSTGAGAIDSLSLLALSALTLVASTLQIHRRQDA